MVSLLKALAKQGAAPSYALRLLAAGTAADDGAPLQQGLIEPLSVRELEVLRLLGTDLDGPGIARELVVSLNTVRTHTKNIYAKLGVNNRRTAVRRAADLDLVPRRRGRLSRVAAPEITTSITRSGDPRSSPPLLAFAHRGKRGARDERITRRPF
jgi:LuxR family transcriptional regulator, maltose regulon positive regulatory protein